MFFSSSSTVLRRGANRFSRPDFPIDRSRAFFTPPTSCVSFWPENRKILLIASFVVSATRHSKSDSRSQCVSDVLIGSLHIGS